MAEQAVQVAVDTFFYRKIAVVPWNIVFYNIFSGSGKGPDIYGTEPWHFYIRNLLINFNAWFVLALLSFPLVLWQHFVRRQVIAKLSIIRSIVILCPFYLWLAIFTLQPHKEERFMYPAYPALALNAAVSLHVVLSSFGSTDPRDLVSKIPPLVKLAVVSAFVLACVNLGFLRILALASGYSAPLKVYSPLQQANVTQPGDFVCLGKEWYRFPSSYHLPEHVKAKFIRSEFRGLLPGEFSEANVGFGFYPGAWLIPSGMNDENKEDPSKYVSSSVFGTQQDLADTGTD
jgi:alpha-1,2-mannosyltransferase